MVLLGEDGFVGYRRCVIQAPARRFYGLEAVRSVDFKLERGESGTTMVEVDTDTHDAVMGIAISYAYTRIGCKVFSN